IILTSVTLHAAILLCIVHLYGLGLSSGEDVSQARTWAKLIQASNNETATARSNDYILRHGLWLVSEYAIGGARKWNESTGQKNYITPVIGIGYPIAVRPGPPGSHITNIINVGKFLPYENFEFPFRNTNRSQSGLSESLFNVNEPENVNFSGDEVSSGSGQFLQNTGNADLLSQTDSYSSYSPDTESNQNVVNSEHVEEQNFSPETTEPFHSQKFSNIHDPTSVTLTTPENDFFVNAFPNSEVSQTASAIASRPSFSEGNNNGHDQAVNNLGSQQSPSHDEVRRFNQLNLSSANKALSHTSAVSDVNDNNSELFQQPAASLNSDNNLQRNADFTNQGLNFHSETLQNQESNVHRGEEQFASQGIKQVFANPVSPIPSYHTTSSFEAIQSNGIITANANPTDNIHRNRGSFNPTEQSQQHQFNAVGTEPGHDLSNLKPKIPFSDSAAELLDSYSSYNEDNQPDMNSNNEKLINSNQPLQNSQTGNRVSYPSSFPSNKITQPSTRGPGIYPQQQAPIRNEIKQTNPTNGNRITAQLVNNAVTRPPKQPVTSSYSINQGLEISHDFTEDFQQDSYASVNGAGHLSALTVNANEGHASFMGENYEDRPQGGISNVGLNSAFVQHSEPDISNLSNQKGLNKNELEQQTHIDGASSYANLQGSGGLRDSAEVFQQDTYSSFPGSNNVGTQNVENNSNKNSITNDRYEDRPLADVSNAGIRNGVMQQNYLDAGNFKNHDRGTNRNNLGDFTKNPNVPDKTNVFDSGRLLNQGGKSPDEYRNDRGQVSIGKYVNDIRPNSMHSVTTGLSNKGFVSKPHQQSDVYPDAGRPNNEGAQNNNGFKQPYAKIHSVSEINAGDFEQQTSSYSSEVSSTGNNFQLSPQFSLYSIPSGNQNSINVENEGHSQYDPTSSIPVRNGGNRNEKFEQSSFIGSDTQNGIRTGDVSQTSSLAYKFGLNAQEVNNQFFSQPDNASGFSKPIRSNEGQFIQPGAYSNAAMNANTNAPPDTLSYDSAKHPNVGINSAGLHYGGLVEKAVMRPNMYSDANGNSGVGMNYEENRGNLRHPYPSVNNDENNNARLSNAGINSNGLSQPTFASSNAGHNKVVQQQNSLVNAGNNNIVQQQNSHFNAGKNNEVRQQNFLYSAPGNSNVGLGNAGDHPDIISGSLRQPGFYPGGPGLNANGHENTRPNNAFAYEPNSAEATSVGGKNAGVYNVGANIGGNYVENNNNQGVSTAGYDRPKMSSMGASNTFSNSIGASINTGSNIMQTNNAGMYGGVKTNNKPDNGMGSNFAGNNNARQKYTDNNNIGSSNAGQHDGRVGNNQENFNNAVGASSAGTYNNGATEYENIDNAAANSPSVDDRGQNNAGSGNLEQSIGNNNGIGGYNVQVPVDTFKEIHMGTNAGGLRPLHAFPNNVGMNSNGGNSFVPANNIGVNNIHVNSAAVNLNNDNNGIRNVEVSSEHFGEPNFFPSSSEINDEGVRNGPLVTKGLNMNNAVFIGSGISDADKSIGAATQSNSYSATVSNSNSEEKSGDRRINNAFASNDRFRLSELLGSVIANNIGMSDSLRNKGQGQLNMYSTNTGNHAGKDITSQTNTDQVRISDSSFPTQSPDKALYNNVRNNNNVAGNTGMNYRSPLQPISNQHQAPANSNALGNREFSSVRTNNVANNDNIGILSVSQNGSNYSSLSNTAGINTYDKDNGISTQVNNRNSKVNSNSAMLLDYAKNNDGSRYGQSNNANSDSSNTVGINSVDSNNVVKGQPPYSLSTLNSNQNVFNGNADQNLGFTGSGFNTEGSRQPNVFPVAGSSNLRRIPSTHNTQGVAQLNPSSNNVGTNSAGNIIDGNTDAGISDAFSNTGDSRNSNTNTNKAGYGQRGQLHGSKDSIQENINQGTGNRLLNGRYLYMNSDRLNKMDNSNNLINSVSNNQFQNANNANNNEFLDSSVVGKVSQPDSLNSFSHGNSAGSDRERLEIQESSGLNSHASNAFNNDKSHLQFFIPELGLMHSVLCSNGNNDNNDIHSSNNENSQGNQVQNQPASYAFPVHGNERPFKLIASLSDTNNGQDLANTNFPPVSVGITANANTESPINFKIRGTAAGSPVNNFRAGQNTLQNSNVNSKEQNTLQNSNIKSAMFNVQDINVGNSGVSQGGPYGAKYAEQTGFADNSKDLGDTSFSRHNMNANLLSVMNTNNAHEQVLPFVQKAQLLAIYEAPSSQHRPRGDFALSAAYMRNRLHGSNHQPDPSAQLLKSQNIADTHTQIPKRANIEATHDTGVLQHSGYGASDFRQNRENLNGPNIDTVSEDSAQDSNDADYYDDDYPDILSDETIYRESVENAEREFVKPRSFIDVESRTFGDEKDYIDITSEHEGDELKYAGSTSYVTLEFGDKIHRRNTQRNTQGPLAVAGKSPEFWITENPEKRIPTIKQNQERSPERIQSHARDDTGQERTFQKAQNCGGEWIPIP
ncbi:hypothetical protein SK128_018573, partial [Halocaridina rubra]